MLPPVEYLEWASAHYDGVRFDLATSGITPVPARELGDPQALLEAAHDARVIRRYTDAIAARFSVDPANIAPASGTTHALWAACAALVSAGDEVVVESPVYEPLLRVPQGLGARVVTFERDLKSGAALDPARVAAAMTAKTKLVIVSNPHNPTGVCAPDAVVVEIAALAARVGAMVLVDEVYRDLGDADPANPGRGKTVFGLAPNIVSISSLTKVYGLGWARIGWVLASREIAARARSASLHVSPVIAPVGAAIGCVALSRMEHLLGRSIALRKDDARARDRVKRWASERPHLSLVTGDAAIFGFVSDARGGDLRGAIERAIATQQVIVGPGSFFGAPSGFRIRYGAMPIETLDEGLARLGGALD